MPPSTRVSLLVCALSIGATLLPGGAGAAGLSPPVADCNKHGQLTQHYSAAELRSALATMPADIKEYTSCPDVIQRALLGDLGLLHGRGSGSGGGSFLPTPVIVVLALVVVGGVGYATWVWRRRNP